MQTVTLGSSNLESSRLVYGCMRIAGSGSPEDLDRGKQALGAAVDAGYTQFDHADIYGNGLCETLFGGFLRDNPGVREQVIVTTKCGIRMAGDPDEDAPGRYDFSARHITSSVDASLRRLGIERIDLLLLHRPDYLFRAHEVAVTLEALKASGAVANFGVSNFTPSQVELLQSAVGDALLVNQVEINLHNISTLTDGTLDQCQRLGMTPQAWCPLAGVAYPAWGNTLTEQDERRIRAELECQRHKYDAEDWLVALAWLLKHPAGISPIIGSTMPERIEAAKRALDLEYSRVDWYRLLEARNGAPVP
jgi:predicted oxidoreductase